MTNVDKNVAINLPLENLIDTQRDGNLHRSDGPPARRGRVMQSCRSLHHRIKSIII